MKRSGVLNEKVKIHSLPKIILICGPARSGTTALSYLFARSGVPSHMQPLKSMIRAATNNEEICPWIIDKSSGQTILSKETIGPEAFFNPVKILADLGYPKERIVPILMVRDEAETLCSWETLWEEIDRENFVQAYHTMKKIADYCHRQSVPYISFVHGCTHNNPVEIIGALLKKCGIDASPQEVMDWSNATIFDPCTNLDPYVVFYDEPPGKFIKGIGRGNSYGDRSRVVTEDIRRFISEHRDISEIHNSFRQECEEEFGISL